jgi:hypothetical protein
MYIDCAVKDSKMRSLSLAVCTVSTERVKVVRYTGRVSAMLCGAAFSFLFLFLRRLAMEETWLRLCIATCIVPMARASRGGLPVGSRAKISPTFGRRKTLLCYCGVLEVAMRLTRTWRVQMSTKPFQRRLGAARSIAIKVSDFQLAFLQSTVRVGLQCSYSSAG